MTAVVATSMLKVEVFLPFLIDLCTLLIVMLPNLLATDMKWTTSIHTFLRQTTQIVSLRSIDFKSSCLVV